MLKKSGRLKQRKLPTGIKYICTNGQSLATCSIFWPSNEYNRKIKHFDKSPQLSIRNPFGRKFGAYHQGYISFFKNLTEAWHLNILWDEKVQSSVIIDRAKFLDRFHITIYNMNVWQTVYRQVYPKPFFHVQFGKRIRCCPNRRLNQ